MIFYQKQQGYLLLQCAIALFCVSMGLSLLLKLHVKSLHDQKKCRTEAVVLIHAASARAIQHSYTNSAQNAWQQSLERTIPAPRYHILWQPDGPMQICWEDKHCWQLE